MLKQCVEDLSRLSPSHYETQTAHDAAAAFGRPWVRWLGWVALAVVCLVTALRGFVARAKVRQNSVGKLGAVGAFFGVALALTWASPARAVTAEEADEAAKAADIDAPSRPLGQLSTKFRIDIDNPMAGMPSLEQRNKDPIQFGYWLMDLTVLADNALIRGNYADAAKFFEVVVAAVPDRGIGYSKLCKAYVALNDRDKAIRPCRTALAYQGATVEDHLRYARLLISKPGKLDAREIGDIDEQVKHLSEDKKLEPHAYRIACELALRLDDEKRLETCTAGLVRLEPDDLGTVSFQWALAIRKGQFDEAEKFVTRASALGMNDEGIAKMRAGSQKMKPMWRLALENLRFVVGGSLFLLAASVLLVTWRRTVRRSEKAGSPGRAVQSS